MTSLAAISAMEEERQAEAKALIRAIAETTTMVRMLLHKFDPTRLNDVSRYTEHYVTAFHEAAQTVAPMHARLTVGGRTDGASRRTDEGAP